MCTILNPYSKVLTEWATYSSADVLPFGKYLSVGKPETPNLEPSVLSPSASTLAIITSSALANASPSCS